MPLHILLLVLCSSFLHAGWNYLAKTIPGGAQFVWLLALVMSVILLPLSVGQIIFFGFEWSSTNVGALLLTGILHTVYFLTLQKGYQEADLSVVYPLARGMGPVFSGIGAYLFLQEKISISDLLGLLCVGAGALIIGGFRFKRKASAVTDPRLAKGIFYGILTGFLISMYTIFDAFCVKNLSLAPILVEYTAHPIRLLLLMPVALNHRPELHALWKAHWKKIVTISIVSPSAFILVLYAMKSAPVHAVAPVREFSIVIGVFLGAKYLAEEDFRGRLIGAMLILAGIGLLALGF